MVQLSCPQCGAERSVQAVSVIHADGFYPAAVGPPARPELARLRVRWSAYCLVVLPTLIVLFAQSSRSLPGTVLVAVAVLTVWSTQFAVRRSRLRVADERYRAQVAVWRQLFGCLYCGIVFLPDGADPAAEAGRPVLIAETREFVQKCAARAMAVPG